MNYLVTTVLIASLLGAPQPGQCQLVEIQTPQHATFELPADRSVTMDQVREGVAHAAAARGWQIVEEQPCQFTLHTEFRGNHRIDVNVTYDRKSVQVDYLSSENLNYRSIKGVGYIHPKYNAWVNFLIEDIVAKVTF